MKPLHGVLFGHGHMGALHAKTVSKRDELRLTVVDPAQGLTPPVPSRPDFAIIATPTASHIDVAETLLRQDIPCLVEKPLAVSSQEAQRIAKHPLLCVAHIERFNPAIAPVTDVRPRFFQSDRLAQFPTDPHRVANIDVISDLMIHDLDLALHFLPGEITDLRAIGLNVVGTQVDIAHVRLEIQGNDGRIKVANLTASRVSRERVRQLRLISPANLHTPEDANQSAGTYWSIDLLAKRTTRVRWEKEQPVPKESEALHVSPDDALERQLHSFLAFVQGQGTFPVNGSIALRTIEVADRVRDAINQTG